MITTVKGTENEIVAQIDHLAQSYIIVNTGMVAYGKETAIYIVEYREKKNENEKQDKVGKIALALNTETGKINIVEDN